MDIRDGDSAENVPEELQSRKLWPDPLIQFNPAYEQAISMEGVLHELLAKVFQATAFTRTRRPRSAWVPRGRALWSHRSPVRAKA